VSSRLLSILSARGLTTGVGADDGGGKWVNDA